jgi:hypothetical protein
MDRTKFYNKKAMTNIETFHETNFEVTFSTQFSLKWYEGSIYWRYIHAIIYTQSTYIPKIEKDKEDRAGTNKK